MDISLVILLILIVLSVALIVWAHVSSKKDFKKRRTEDLKWQEEQSKIIADIVFETKEGKHKNSRWYCYQDFPGEEYNWKITAWDRARQGIDKFFEKGYFEDNLGVKYPVCNVIKVWIEVRSNEI